MNRIAFVIHGKLRKGKLGNTLKEFFAEEYDIQLLFSEKASQAIELSRKAVNVGCDYLIAVGGDGTLNEVVNGLMQNSLELRKQVILGLIPAGSGNDFAKTVGVENDIKALKEYIRKDKTIPLDIGKLKFQTIDNKEGERYFINISDIGIGGYVAQILDDIPKFIGANLSYGISIIRGFLGYKHQRVKLTHDSGEWSGKVMSLCMANGAWFGSGMGIAPNANPTDGKMQLVILGDVSLLDYVKNLPTINKGERVKHPEVQYLDSAHCKIEALDKPCPIDMDGEFIGHTPIEMKTISNEIRFLSAQEFK